MALKVKIPQVITCLLALTPSGPSHQAEDWPQLAITHMNRAQYQAEDWPLSQEILSLGNFVARQNFLGKSVAATIFPRKFCRSILTQRPHFLGNSVALLHRDTLPRSTAEFDIGLGLGLGLGLVAATDFPHRDRISCDTATSHMNRAQYQAEDWPPLAT